jgi:hypothetical protein
MMIAAVTGCSRTARDQRMSETSSPPPTVASVPGPAVAAPIPGHPPVDATGIVASVDTTNGVVYFKDGRAMKLTGQSKVLKAVETATVRPGEQVVVRNVLPVGVQAASKGSRVGKRQKMSTVASVDRQNQIVHMTDGSAVRVTPSTAMHMGTEGAAIVLADLRPGDELIIVVADATPSASDAASARAASSSSGSGSPSAMPRVAAGPMPPDATEVMIFRVIQAQ